MMLSLAVLSFSVWLGVRKFRGNRLGYRLDSDLGESALVG